MFYFSKYQHCQLLQHFYFPILIKVWPRHIYGAFSKKPQCLGTGRCGGPSLEVPWSPSPLLTNTPAWPCGTADGRTSTYQTSTDLHRNFSLFSAYSMRWFPYGRWELRHRFITAAQSLCSGVPVLSSELPAVPSRERSIGGTHCLEETDSISVSLIRKKTAAYLITCKINSSG